MDQDTADAPQDPDWQLFEAYAQHGDLDSFRTLYQRYREPVGRFALGITRRRETAEEVVAESFARLLESPPRPGASFRAFLFTAVRRRCIDRLRRQRTAERHEVPEPDPSVPNGEALLLASERNAHVRRAVAALPEKHREVLLLYYGQDLSSGEVAEILGCTAQQVRSRVAYARRLLRDRLDPAALGGP